MDGAGKGGICQWMYPNPSLRYVALGVQLKDIAVDVCNTANIIRDSSRTSARKQVYSQGPARKFPLELNSRELCTFT